MKEAKDRAAEVEKNFKKDGAEGLTFPVELRGMALSATRLLEPFGKTIMLAAEFYKAQLQDVKEKEASALVAKLAQEWLDEKKSGKRKTLRSETLRGIAAGQDIADQSF